MACLCDRFGAGRSTRTRERGRVGWVAALIVSAGIAHGQSPRSPVLHRTLTATVPQRQATFGYTLVMGKIGGLLDPRDDVIACAINEDRPLLTPGGVDRGVAYPFIDESLAPHPIHPDLEPSVQQTLLQLGRLRPALGDVRGGQRNLLFLGTWQRSDVFASCEPPVAVNAMGAVEIYDVPSAGTALVHTLLPPPDAGDCAPIGVQHFGLSIAIANVDADAYRDLIVGAPGSDDAVGRVYVFFGHSAFDQAPDASWVALHPPVGGGTGTGFGTDVGGADLDGDGLSELIVGRPERSTGPGRTYLISGAWIAGLTRGQLHAMGGAPTSASQVLVNPLDPDQDAYGFRVYAPGDVGSHPLASVTQLDELPDVAVHGEGTRVASLNDAGALFVYFNNDDGVLGAPFVNDTPGTRLFFASPDVQDRGRFGRGAARIRWARSDGTLADHLLVGEPNATVDAVSPADPNVTTSFVDAGRIWMFALPLTTTSVSALAQPISEPEVADGNVFGADIVVGDYLNDAAYPGQQFVASGRYTRAGVPALQGAGKVYSFRPAPVGP